MNVIKHSSKQRGIGSLLMAVVLLVLSILLAYYAASGAITEQRLAANQVRTKQAFMAAQAGIEQALEYMKNGGVDRDGDSYPDVQLSKVLGGGAVYRAAFCGASVTPPPCPAAPPGQNLDELSDTFSNLVSGTSFCWPQPRVPSIDLTRMQVWSCGWSDDQSSVQRVTQLVMGTPATAGGSSPPVPLITLGSANLLVGGASILNYENDLTTWSGQSFQGQSNTGKTFIRDTSVYPVPDPNFNVRNVGNSPACNNPPTGYVCSTQGSTTGHDVIEADQNLASMGVDGLFAASFGTSQTNYRDNVASWRVNLTNNTVPNTNSTNINSIYGKGDTAIWVEGNGTIDGVVGSANAPVVLIVNGNLSLGANAVINGILFVTGNLNSNGTPTVYGSATVGGTANTTGNLKVVYDSYKSKGGSPYNSLGVPTKLNGSWKDW